jgi:UDP-3-O-acyl-N-acetylglucosamine deacetylase
MNWVQAWWYILLGRQRQKDSEFETSVGKVSKTFSKTTKTDKRTESMVQMVEHLPSMLKALGSITSSVKIKRKL